VKHRIDPGTNLRHQTARAYTDGTCHNNEKANAQCDSGIWFGPNDPRNKSTKVPENDQSNQIGELVAVIEAVQTLPTFSPLEIHTDSKYAIYELTTHLPHWEDIGWITVQNAALFQKAAFLLRHRSTTTQFKWVKGHNSDLGNKESDKLTKEGASKANPDALDLQVPIEFDFRGAKLSTLSQALAY